MIRFKNGLFVLVLVGVGALDEDAEVGEEE
jgi:hypothetical protein